ncbi:MAG: nucleotide-binding protein [Gemmatimonadaceae bacterium]
MRRVLSFLFLVTAAAGCGSKTAESAKVPLDQMPAVASNEAAAPAPAADGLTGPVQEVLPAAPYVYLRVKTTKGEVWAAVPEAKIAKGAVVTVFNPMLMSKFESKTLKRTFDEVYFGTLSADGGVPAMGAGENPHASVGKPTEPVKVGKVEKAAGADARTVAEAWAQAAALEGKVVTVRGTVVKFNGGVMGKNWVHLQDGSGDAAKGTNDITFTTMDEAAVGQTITMRGTAHTNKDFGAGYKYAIIVEEAKIVR